MEALKWTSELVSVSSGQDATALTVLFGIRCIEWVGATENCRGPHVRWQRTIQARAGQLAATLLTLCHFGSSHATSFRIYH